MSTHVPEVDFYNLYAQRVFGVPAEWQWHTLRGKTIGDRDLFLVEGAVCTAKFKTGPRAGTTNWSKRDMSTEVKFTVPRNDFEAFKSAWERETGSCMKCFGTGLQWVGWSATEGDKRGPCSRGCKP